MIETASLSEQIESELKEEIVSGALSPGQRISIDELASKWGVSTTPVRDAVRRLESLGFVDVAPRRGVYISNFDRRAFKDVFELRIALECQAVESATKLIPIEEIERALDVYRAAARHLRETGDLSLLVENDHLIHDLVVRYCDNQKLVEIMGELSDLIDWARATVVIRHPSSYEEALPEHLCILEALRVRDAEAARNALRAHLKRAFDRTVGAPSDAG